MTPRRTSIFIVSGSFDIFWTDEQMKIFCALEFSPDFVGEGKLDFVRVIKVYSFNDILIVLFVEDPREED